MIRPGGLLFDDFSSLAPPILDNASVLPPPASLPVPMIAVVPVNLLLLLAVAYAAVGLAAVRLRMTGSSAFSALWSLIAPAVPFVVVALSFLHFGNLSFDLKHGLLAVALGLAFFPPGEAFWRRLHGLTTEPAIVAEDKTGLSLLKMANAQDGRLYIQGHSQSWLPFHTVHAFLGGIGPLTHPAPKRVLVIGSGTGGTPYAAGLRPDTDRVRVVEIVKPVMDTLQVYRAVHPGSAVDRLLGTAKFEIVVADGRHTLALDTGKWDVIEADAILPKTGLSGLLNSREFFEQVRSRLAPGGLYVQWAPTDRTVATFRSVFPYVTMVHPALIGSDRPIPYDRDRLLGLLADPRIDDHLAAARVDRGELRQWFADKKIEVLNDGRTVPAATPNTDLFPRDEFYLNRP